MPIIKTGDGYIYKKNKKETERTVPKSLSFLFVFLLVVGSIALSFFTYSKFDVTSALKLNKYKIFDSKSYYAVSVLRSDNFEEISANINSIKSQNGAGFVYKANSNYYLITSIYNSNGDATKVVQNLTNFNAEIIKIDLSQLVLSSNYSTSQMSAIKSALNLVHKSFDKLYEISVSFDRGEILEAEAKQKLQVFKETCQMEKESLSNVFNNCCDNLITHIKIYQSEVIANLSALLLSQNFSSDIKYVNISNLSSFISLQNEVKK